MKSKTLIKTIAGIILLTTPFIANAQQVKTQDVPRTISYQGLLTSADGTPMPSGIYDITVTLYADETGSQSIWQQTYSATVLNGLFNLYLGNGEAPLPPSDQMNRPLWVGTTVNGMNEMRPLTPLSSSPYALNLPDRAITTSKLADGAVTAEKVEMDYISGLTINGEKISGKGAVLDIRSGNDIALDYDKTNNVLNISRGTQTGTSDPEKGGAIILAGTATDEVWSKTGDIWDISAGASVSPASTDWIGTSNNVNFTIKVNDGGAATGGNQRVMQYRPNGTSANILGGHNANSIGNGVGNTIAGGGSNASAHAIGNSSDYGTISGGRGNSISGGAGSATIGGGRQNGVTASEATIGGGVGNAALGTQSTIGGGSANAAAGDWSTIAGGTINEARASWSFVGGGDGNIAADAGVESAIGGGHNNEIKSPRSFIGGGYENLIDTLGDQNAIAGGDSNSIYANSEDNFIGGGETNAIHEDVNYSVVGGGVHNNVHASNSSILGGSNNTIQGGLGLYNTLGGGYFNLIAADVRYATLSGGEGNRINAYHASIAGGSGNVANGTASALLGGQNLKSITYAQAAVGFANAPRGTMPDQPDSATIAASDDPLFMVGNGPWSGGQTTPRNAFEVSYNGHSVVYDVNETGGYAPGPARSAIEGATYTDNVIYGWANVDLNGQLILPCEDFGVDTIEHYPPGAYRIKLNISKPDGTPATIDCGAVVATIGTGEDPAPGHPDNRVRECVQIVTTNIVGNVFDVFITRRSSGTEECNEGIDMPFKFHVTGRVNME